MKLKYYMRGIGVGMVFSAILFSVNDKAEMTDEQIIEEAKKLGMVETVQDSAENSTDSPLFLTATPVPQVTDKEASKDISIVPDVTGEAGMTTGERDNLDSEMPKISGQPEGAEVSEPAVSEKSTEISGSAVSEKQTEIPEPTVGTKPTEIPDPTEVIQPTITPVTQIGEKGVIVIKEGMHSEDVARLLYQAGIIDDLMEFNSYLVSNGYAHVIRYGTYSFEKGTSYYNIAERITKIY